MEYEIKSLKFPVFVHLAEQTALIRLKLSGSRGYFSQCVHYHELLCNKMIVFLY